MTEFTPFFDGSNQLNYRKFVILRFHGVSKRKICKMYNFAYFRILEVCVTLLDI
ncbi:transposon-related protein [Staphylococcus aureus]|nr:transposon-related protein [Staphylococcus aureus]